MRRPYRTDAQIERAKRINPPSLRNHIRSGSKKFFDALLYGPFDKQETD